MLLNYIPRNRFAETHIIGVFLEKFNIIFENKVKRAIGMIVKVCEKTMI